MLYNYTIEGFESIQPQDNHAFQKIISNLMDLYKSFGYHQIATPTFEAYDLYVNENSIPSDDLFKMVDHKGRVLVLKPDVTLPITRMAAINHPNDQEIIKFSYQTSIYRNFSAPESIKKEINQIGLEYFGNDSPECDGEIIGLSILSLLKAGIKDIHIDLGHVGFINYLFDEFNFTSDQRNRLFQYIENKNVGDIKTYLTKLKLDQASRDIILKLPSLYGCPKDIIAKMKTMCVNENMEKVVKKVSDIYDHLKIMDLDAYISFDLGFTNQMNYYSDIIFKGYINNWGEPIISGGRYNQLSQKFGISRPACGFAIDLMKILDYLDRGKKLAHHEKAKRILFYHPDDKKLAYCLADQFRNDDIITELFILTMALSDQLRNLKTNPLYTNTEIFYLSKGKLDSFKDNDLIAQANLNKEVLQ